MNRHIIHAGHVTPPCPHGWVINGCPDCRDFARTNETARAIAGLIALTAADNNHGILAYIDGLSRGELEGVAIGLAQGVASRAVLLGEDPARWPELTETAIRRRQP